MKKRGESRELLRPLVRLYVEAHLVSERGKRWMPVMTAIRGFVVAPYFAVEHAMDEHRIAKENNEKRGSLKLLRDWFDVMRMMWGLYWYGLINSRESDEEWQEFVDEQVEYAVFHVRESWLILLDIATYYNGDTILVVDGETMLPALSASQNSDFDEVVKETFDYGHYGIGWNEFAKILKEVKKQIPEKILPDDIMKLFDREGVIVVSG